VSNQIHPTAVVSPEARIGDGVAIWEWSKVREGAEIGDGTTLGQGVYVDHDVHLGARCKVQNGVSIYHGVTIGHEVFVGPHVTFTNDRVPRAFGDGWEVVETLVEDRASIGANATVVCGTRLGRACMVGAGAVVVRDVPPHALVVGNPATVIDYVALDGSRLHVGPSGAPPIGTEP
jgi:UDP-2-acetamido-3-amino-2,3-dideoxy-glucuronate N-acetyltransferase